MLKFKGLLVSHAIIALGLLGATGSAAAQSWTNQSNMKVGRVEATTVDYRNDIYVFNGFKPGIRIAESVEKYSAATKQWSIVSTTSTGNGSAVTHNGVIRNGADVWIIGGRIGSHPGLVSNKVWIYNLDSGKWRSGPKLPKQSAAGGAALVNNKVHWIGGLDRFARCDVANHFVYDLGKPAAGWKDITASAGMPSPRNHFSTAVVDGIIYVMGGQYGHDNCPGKRTQDTPLVHAYNPANNKWSQKASMPNKNSHSEPGTFVYKGDIYTTGGENAGDKVWKYNPRANKWSTFRTLPEILVAPVARIIDGNLIVAGGGAPRAALATDKVRSMRVDNNPPAVQQPAPSPQPEPPKPEPEPPKPPEPGSHKPEGPTLISMEAEYFDVSKQTSTHQWVHVTRGNTSNDDAMITTPDQGDLAASTDNTPMLSYMVYFNHTGKHYIWVRGSGDSNSAGVGNSDSIHVGLNGTVASTAYRIDQFPNEWTWSRHTPSNPVASLNVVNAGVNIVNFWMREDGLAIDKFVITSDPDFVPNGYGPEVTDGTNNYVPPVTIDENEAESNADNTPVVEETVEVQPEDIKPASESPVEDGSQNIPAEESTTDLPQEDTDASNQAEVNTNVEISDSVATDSSDSNPMVEGPDADDMATLEAIPEANENDNWLFGGSASTTFLLSLLAMCIVRVSRFKG